MSACHLVIASLGLALVSGCGSTTSVWEPTDAGCSESVIDGGGVVDPPEAGAPFCPSGVCNYQAQTGCSSGQACRPQFTATSPDVSAGCEAAGRGKAGAVCSAGSDCAAGYFCAGGFCRKQCCHGDWSACDPGESCISRLEVKVGGKVIGSGMDLCFPVNDCDPLSVEPCPNALDRECKIVDPTGAVACEPLSLSQAGDLCDAQNSCAAALVCVLDHCRRLCRADACGEPACDPEDGACVHFARDPAGVGECTPGF